MISRSSLFAAALVGLLAAMPASAAAEPVPALSGTLDSLAGSMRGYLSHALPATLFEDRPGWGHTKKFVNGVTWRGKGFHVHPEVRHAEKNDGVWRKVTVTTENLPDTLIFDLRNPRLPEKGPLTFAAFVSFDARVEYERQNWQSGVRLYSGSTRARFRVKLYLTCEASSRLEKTDSLLPDVVFRLKVVRADLHYDNLVFEHVPGLGGEAAKLIGAAVKGGLHRFHPSLEQQLLAKANAAIVKAADTKEVRLSLSRLLER